MRSKSKSMTWRLAAVLCLAMILVASQPETHARASAGRGDSPLACPRFQTILGGSGSEYVWDSASDPAGNVYITGMTDSEDFPMTSGSYDSTYNGNADAFVVKLNPFGRVLYATYLGGKMLDQGSKIAVDSLGNAYIAGYTYSTDFPVTANAFDRDFNGGDIDAFVAKLDPSGRMLVYSTFLGGSGDDYGGGITVNSSGVAYVTGYTESSDYPTSSNAYDKTYNGGGDIIATALAPDGSSLQYSTFAGGSAFEGGYGIGLDSGNNLAISGITSSLNFPVTPHAFGKVYGGGAGDAFVLKFSPDGQSLKFATYLGGEEFDDARALAVDAKGAVVVGGRTSSLEFPVTDDAYDPYYIGGRDVFISRISADGSTLAYSTYLGGTGEEETGDIALDGFGNIGLTGWTFSEDFPVTADACQPYPGGDYDQFFLIMNRAGSDLITSTYRGGMYADYGRGLSFSLLGRVYLAGYSTEPPADASVVMFAR